MRGMGVRGGDVRLGEGGGICGRKGGKGELGEVIRREVEEV